jgi:SnoaL-like domain
MSLIDDATLVLATFARADVDRAQDLCARDLLLYGTDVGELWSDRESFIAALDGMRELGLRARWREDPTVGDRWVAGIADFTLAHGTTLPVRVTLVFAEGKLVHGHYSVASEEPSGGHRSA